MRGGNINRVMRGNPASMRGGMGGPIRVQQPMRGGVVRGGQRGRGGPIPARGMARGAARPPVNIRPVGPNVRPVLNVRPGQPRAGFTMRPNMRPSGPNNGSIRPSLARPGGPINISMANGPRPANGVRQNFTGQPRMNNGSVRPNGPAQRGAPPNFTKPNSQQQHDTEEENSNDSNSTPLPSFGNTWGSQNFDFTNNFDDMN
eukprot:GFUD01020559.1.p1 GENE.GFUD01020559.1~~GFUD01020559.1.p1  ORF type:complete len:225 (+),score=42.11 GFUD01020559.1:70-675(+)